MDNFFSRLLLLIGQTNKKTSKTLNLNFRAIIRLALRYWLNGVYITSGFLSKKRLKQKSNQDLMLSSTLDPSAQ